MKDKFVCMGRFVSAHGIAGEVKVEIYSDSINSVFEYKFYDHCFLPLNWKLRVFRKNILLAKVDNINSKSVVQNKLIGNNIYILASDMIGLDNDNFYIKDLVGLEVRAMSSEIIGSVAWCHNFGAGDIIEIKLNKLKNNKIQLPFTKEMFPEINLAEGYLLLSDITYVSDDEEF